jgi:cytochrome d ubiquinol oxidase subunit II
MPGVWYALIAMMLTVYVVLDGFDFGAGILHNLVARTDEERRTVLAAILPVWDGNEVWLIASGGVLVFAFPRAYAAAFSGFYLPLMMVLWLIILRGLAIELRSHDENPLWRAFWDGVLGFSSAVITVVLGASLGNVIRGVPLAEGEFHTPLFTNFRVGPDVGALDWYTLLVGLYALVALTAHGATYLAWKTDGVVGERTAAVARRAWLAVIGALPVVSAASAWIQPILARQLLARPAAWPFGALVVGGIAAAVLYLRRGRPLAAFLGSSAFLAGTLGATAVGLYPVILRSTVAPSFDLTAENAASGRDGLVLGLVWWTPAILLAVGYFVFLFRSFRGKVRPAEH